MAYDFKNLSEIEAQDKPTENTTVMAFEGGVPKQIPAGELGGKGLVVDLRSYSPIEVIDDWNYQYVIEDMNYDQIYEAFINGRYVVCIVNIDDIDCYFVPSEMQLIPGEGLVISMYSWKNDRSYLFAFTTGSYHTTSETASE